MIFYRQIFQSIFFASSPFSSHSGLERSSIALSPQTVLKRSGSLHIRSLNLLLCFLLRSRKLTLILEIFSQFSVNSIQIDSNTHFLVAHALIRSHRYEEAKQFISPAEKYDFVIRKSLWDSLIREICASGEDPQRGLSLLHECLRTQGVSPSLITLRSLVFSLSSQGMMEKALDVLETITVEENGSTLVNFVCSSIISGFSRVGKSDLGVGFYKRIRRSQNFQPNLMTYTAVVDALCRQGRIDEVSCLVQEMINNGIVLDVVLYTSWMCGYFRRGLLVDGLQKHGLMSKNGVMPDVVSYTAIIDGLCKEGHLEKIIGLFKYLKKNGLKPNLVTYTAIMQGFCKRSKMDDAFFVFRKMEEMNVVADEFAYSVLIDGLCSSGRLNEVFDLLDEMGRKGIKATSMTYNTVVNGLCKAGQTSKAEEISRNYVGDNFTYSTLLHGYMKENNNKGVIDSIKRLEQSGITLDVVTVNILIKALFSVGKVDDACSLFEKMPKIGLSADSITYCTVVNEYCKLGMLDRALEVFTEYKRTPAFVDDACHAHLIVGLCKKGKIEMAIEFFLEICENNIVPNLITFRHLMKAQFKNGNGEAVLKLVSRVESCDPEILSSICNDAVSFLCQRGCLLSALETYNLMRMKGLSVWSKSYFIILKRLINSGNSWIIELILCDYIKVCGAFEHRMVNIICLYLCKKNVEEAIRFLPGLSKRSISLGVLTTIVSTLKESGRVEDALSFMLEAEENSVPVDVVVYSIIVDGLCKIGSLEKALDLCSNMRNKGIIPNIITYNSVIHGLCREGCLFDAFRVFDSLECNGLSPTIVTFATLIDALCREGFLQDAKQLLVRMSVKGISPNTAIFNHLINGYCRFGLLDEGIQLVGILVGHSLEPDDFTISSLIGGHCTKGDVQGALNLYNEYKGKGLSPDFFGFFAMIKGLFARGRMEEARNIIRDMLHCREVANLINKAGGKLNIESLENYIKLLCEEGRLQEVISILSGVSSKFVSSWGSKNRFGVMDGGPHVVGTFSRSTEKKVHSSGLTILEVPTKNSKLMEDGILERKETKMDEFLYLCQNSLNSDFECYYSAVAALCSKGELQKANDIVKVTLLRQTESV